MSTTDDSATSPSPRSVTSSQPSGQQSTEIHDDATSGLTFHHALEYVGLGAQLIINSRRRRGLRLGQAWFNGLDARDRHKLIGTPFDPFYSEEKDDVVRALAFLLEH